MKRISRFTLLLALSILSALGCGTSHSEQDMKGLYYQGKQHLEANKYAQAHLAFQQVLPMAESLGDSLYLGMAHLYEGILYRKTRNFLEELDAFRKAAEVFQSTGNSSRLRLANYNLARAYWNNSNYKKADSLCLTVYSGRPDLDSLSLQAMTLHADILTDQSIPNYVKARDLYDKIFQANWDVLSNESYCRYALCLINTGNINKADKLIETIDTWAPSANVLYLRAKIAQAKKEDGKALQALSSAYYAMNLENTSLAPSIFKTECDYYQQAAELSNQEARVLRIRGWFLLTGVFLLICLGTLLFLHYRQKQQQQIDRLITAAEESRRMLSEQTRGSNSYRQLFAAQYQSQFAAIGRLAEPFISDGRVGEFKVRASKAYSEQLDTILSEITHVHNKDFERRIDRDLNGIISRIRIAFPQFREQDIRFLTYLIAGFESSTIAFLMDLSKGNIRIRKYRLRRAIEASDFADKAVILDLI